VAGMDLPAVLRALGVPLGGGMHPPAATVRKAYRDAVMRFHPDRQREATLAVRVRSEEAFKIITAKMEAYHG
jgi:DnaJ-class molecular chaperone